MKATDGISQSRLTIGTALASIVIVCGFAAGFSQPNAVAQTSQSQPPQDEDTIVRSIYESTKTAKVESDYTSMLNECDQALSGKLNDKNRTYIKSLRGWALNRRGNLRFELAQQLAEVGNSQSHDAMAKAMLDFEASIKADPARWRSWMSRGIAHVVQQNYKLAVNDFTKVTELKPDETSAWFDRAEANYHAGEFESAVSDYDAVLKVNAQDVQARTGRGHAYYGLSKFDQALEDYESVARTLPNNPETALNLGDAYQMLGRWEEAKNCYLSSIKKKASSKGLQRLAWLRATCPDLAFRDPVIAQTLIDQAVLLGGQTPANLDTLAAVQAANGNFEGAKQTQQQAIQLVSGEQADPVKTQFESRLALYEEGVPFKQVENKE